MLIVAVVAAAFYRASLSSHQKSHADCDQGIGSVTPCRFIFTSLNPCLWHGFGNVYRASLSTYHYTYGIGSNYLCLLWPWYRQRYAVQIHLHINEPMLSVAMVSAALCRASLSTRHWTHSYCDHGFGRVMPCRFIYTSLNPGLLWSWFRKCSVLQICLFDHYSVSKLNKI